MTNFPDHKFGHPWNGQAHTYKHGLVIGKFLPFHAGHEFLIRQALGLCGVVTVIVVRHDGEFVPAERRAYWISQTFVGSFVNVHVVDDIKTDDTTRISSVLWADYTREILGEDHPFDAIFTSEEYGKPWADNLGVKHRLVDIQRKAYNISGTVLREDPGNHLDMLNPLVRADVVPRIVVLGSESTGTTTLSEGLTRHYAEEFYVPEFGRDIAERAAANGTPIQENEWDDGLFRLIAQGQDAREDRLARKAKSVLVCDTDSLATYVWYLRYNPKGSEAVKAELLLNGLKQAKKHTLYIVTDMAGVEWDDDGTRDGENERAWMQVKFLHLLTTYDIPYILVSGSREERLAQATAAIDSAIKSRKLVTIS